MSVGAQPPTTRPQRRPDAGVLESPLLPDGACPDFENARSTRRQPPLTISVELTTTCILLIASKLRVDSKLRSILFLRLSAHLSQRPSGTDQHPPHPIDLSKTTKLEDVEFKYASSNCGRTIMTLHTFTPGRRDLRHISIQMPRPSRHNEIRDVIRRVEKTEPGMRWSDPDCLLGKIWKTRAVRSTRTWRGWRNRS